jgi:hypothetical protein
MPSGGIKEDLVLLIELQSLPEENNGFLPRPGAVAALEISHCMCAQAGQCRELLLRQTRRATKTPQDGTKRR